MSNTFRQDMKLLNRKLIKHDCGNSAIAKFYIFFLKQQYSYNELTTCLFV